MKKILRKIKKAWSKLLCKKNNEGGYVSLNNDSQYGKISGHGYVKRDPAVTRKMIEEAYPDGAKFLSCISEYKTGNTTIPIFLLNAHFAGLGFVSAKSSGDFIKREVLLQEINRALEERAHSIDIAGVRIDGRHEGSDFVIQLRFSELPIADKESNQ